MSPPSHYSDVSLLLITIGPFAGNEEMAQEEECVGKRLFTVLLLRISFSVHTRDDGTLYKQKVSFATKQLPPAELVYCSMMAYIFKTC